jgi:nucleoside-diphosphate-sugar epimerase
MSSNSRILVTGASGFIGVNLVKLLAKSKRKVLGTTRNPSGPDQLIQEYLEGLENYVDWVTVDLTHYDDLMSIADDYDITGIIHAAVFTAITKEIEQSRAKDILESNLMGTVNTLELARKTGSKKLVYVSSSGLYGSTDDPKTPVPETSTAPYLKSGGLYQITKVASERITARYNELSDLSTTSMRIAAPYGDMERPTGSRYLMGPIYRLLKMILTEKKEKIHVKGMEYIRDWTYVLDTAKCLISGLDAEAPSQLYNVACGINSSLEDILNSIQDVPSIDFEWEEVQKDRDADFLVKVGSLRGPLSIEKSRSELGFKPDYDLKKGIRAYCDWWQQVTQKGLWPPK